MLRAEQIARTFFSHTADPKRSAATLVRRMAGEGLVNSNIAILHPEVNCMTPLFEFHPGDRSPDFEMLAWRAKSRFRKPPIRTNVVTAGAKLIPTALQRPVRRTELLHDTILSAVFLQLVTTDHAAFDKWQHEDARRDATVPGDKVPDAVLREKDTLVFIECIGSYAGHKIKSIHEAFQHVPYRFY